MPALMVCCNRNACVYSGLSRDTDVLQPSRLDKATPWHVPQLERMSRLVMSLLALRALLTLRIPARVAALQ